MALFGMAVEDMPEFKNPDPGDYEGAIVKAEEAESRAGKPMLVLTVRLICDDPDINNSQLKYYHSIPQKGSEYYDLQNKSTRALCEALALEGELEADDFLNLDCRVAVELRQMADGSEFPGIKRFLK